MVVEPSGGSRPEFRDLDSFCKTEIAPWLKAHEGRQRSARRLRWLIIGTGFAALAAGCYYLLRQPAGTHEVWFLGLLAGAVAVVKLGNLPHWRLRTDVRTFVMSKLAGFFDFTYQEHAAIDEIELFRDLKLLPPDTSVDFGGGLQGVIESIPFQMVEIHLTERHATGRSSDTMTVFRGLLLSMPCNAAGIITVRRRGDVAWSDGEEQGAAALGDAAFHENYVVHESEPGAAGHVLGAAARRLFTKLDSGWAYDPAACCSSSNAASPASRTAVWIRHLPIPTGSRPWSLCSSSPSMRSTPSGGSPRRPRRHLEGDAAGAGAGLWAAGFCALI